MNPWGVDPSTKNNLFFIKRHGSGGLAAVGVFPSPLRCGHLVNFMGNGCCCMSYTAAQHPVAVQS